MTRRVRATSAEERALFEATFKDAKALVKNAAKRIAKPKPAVKPISNAARIMPATPKPSGIDGGTDRNLRKGALAPDARLDLHGMTEAAAHRALATFLRGAQARGLRLLLVVTGKGKPDAPDEPFDMSGRRRGVLKTMTPRWLKESELAHFIADVRPAHRRHGGEGALYLYLRKTRA
jgi:DNA-nicking Smr family endonuclease